jgi:hypothetical protein
MNAKIITYWICTALVCVMMTLAAVMYLTHNPHVMESFATLGYPAYFPNILGIAKLLGVVALLVPRFALLKEWAYAGFTITFVSAFISHVVSNDAGHAAPSVVALVLLAISYFLRPPSRRLIAAPTA